MTSKVIDNEHPASGGRPRGGGSNFVFPYAHTGWCRSLRDSVWTWSTYGRSLGHRVPFFFSPLNSLAPTFDADAEASEFGKITIPKPHLMDSGISFWDGSGECAFSSALLVITAADSWPEFVSRDDGDEDGGDDVHESVSESTVFVLHVWHIALHSIWTYTLDVGQRIFRFFFTFAITACGFVYNYQHNIRVNKRLCIRV